MYFCERKCLFWQSEIQLCLKNAFMVATYPVFSGKSCCFFPGIVPDLRPRSYRFQFHPWHHILSFSKTVYLNCLVLVKTQERPQHDFMFHVCYFDKHFVNQHCIWEQKENRKRKVFKCSNIYHKSMRSSYGHFLILQRKKYEKEIHAKLSFL